MKTSFSTLACPDWSLRQVLAAAKDYGYDGVEIRGITRELDLWRLPAFEAAELPATRALIEDHGLQVPCLGSSACFHSPDGAERERNIDSALRMAEVAMGLRAPAIRVFGDRIQDGCGREQTSEWIADALDRIAEKLDGSEVEVWLETHGDFAAASDIDGLFARLIDARVGVVWDPANAFAQSGEELYIPESVLHRIRHVHAKDLRSNGDGKVEYVLIGEGVFPFDTMLAKLRAIDYGGFISIEWEKLWHPELVAPEIALPHFIAWWKRRMIAC